MRACGCALAVLVNAYLRCAELHKDGADTRKSATAPRVRKSCVLYCA